MPRRLLITPSGEFILGNFDSLVGLVCPECHQSNSDNKATKHIFRRKYAHDHPDQTHDLFYVANFQLDIQHTRECTIPLNPYRCEVMEYSSYTRQKIPEIAEPVERFRGPIVITKETHIPLPRGHEEVTDVHMTFDKIWNHDSNPTEVNMTTPDKLFLEPTLDPNRYDSKCVIM